jgi:hypothetical protein
MSIYAGLDVSDKTTHICVVDAYCKIYPRRPRRRLYQGARPPGCAHCSPTRNKNRNQP